MAEVISTCSANDTSGNTSGGGDWYTDLSSWENAAQLRFGTTANEEIVECYNDFGGELNNILKIADWGTTDATNHATVRAAAGQGHDGVVGAGFTVNTTSGTFEVWQAFTHVSGISIKATGNFETVDVNQPNCVFNNLILSRPGAPGKSVFQNNNAQFISLSNTLIHDCIGDYGVEGTANFSQTDMQYVTIDGSTLTHGGVFKFGASRAITLTNCVIYDSPLDISTSASGGIAGNNNATGDSSATDLSVGFGGVTDDDFEDAPGNDWTPKPSGLLEDAGVATAIVTDITGYPRSDPPEIGAYEIASAAPETADTNTFTITIASGTETLDPNDFTQGQQFENVDLVQNYVINADDFTQDQTFDGVSLTQHGNLELADFTQPQAFDNVTFQQLGILDVQDFVQPQTFNNVTLYQHYGPIEVDDFVQDQTFDNVTIAGLGNVLEVQDFTQPQAFQQAILIQNIALVVEDFTQNQQFDNIRFAGLVSGSMTGCLSISATLTGCFEIE